MEHYKLVISQEGTTIEISSHDKDWVEKKEKEYKKEIESILSTPSVVKKVKHPSERDSTEEQPIINSSISINEFYRKYIHGGKVKSQPDIATFFIYYFEKIQGNKEFGPNDIKALFKTVGYPNANKINISDALAKAKKKAFLNNFDNQWTLTITGEDFVLNTMSEIND